MNLRLRADLERSGGALERRKHSLPDDDDDGADPTKRLDTRERSKCATCRETKNVDLLTQACKTCKRYFWYVPTPFWPRCVTFSNSSGCVSARGTHRCEHCTPGEGRFRVEQPPPSAPLKLGLLELPIDTKLPRTRSKSTAAPPTQVSEVNYNSSSSSDAIADATDESKFVITTGSGRGTRHRISVGTPPPPPRATVPPATPAPPPALADGGARQQRAERVRQELVVRDALGNVGEAIRSAAHGPAESSAKPLPPPRDHALPAALDHLLQHAARHPLPRETSNVLDKVEEMLEAELAAFKERPEAEKLLHSAGFDTPTDIDRLTTAIEQLPRVLELIKIYLPVRYRLTATMRRRDKMSELHVCLDVLRQLFALNQQWNLIPAAMAMCLYSYVPTRAAQKFVDHIFGFTVSNTELNRIIESSKEAYKSRVKLFIDRSYTLVLTEDNVDKSIRIGGNKTIVHHFVSRLISIMNTTDTPHLHYGDTPWLTRDKLDVSVFAASSSSSAADLQRLCTEDMITSLKVRACASVRLSVMHAQIKDGPHLGNWYSAKATSNRNIVVLPLVAKNQIVTSDYNDVLTGE